MQLIPLTDPQAAQAAGLPFKTAHQMRWAERTAADNGLEAAFVTIGRRKFLDPDKCHELARARSAER
jgi:hypothetical protein